MDKVPMTVEGYARLQGEAKQLKSVERPAVIRAIAEAREHGDLSENAEYHAARERQSFIEGRPHCVDAMLSGNIQLVFNTVEGAQAQADSFSLRRTALTNNICYYTTVAGARAAVRAIESLVDGRLEVAPLQSYFVNPF